MNLLLALAVLLAPADPSIRDAMKTAVEQPATYLEEHRDTAERLHSSSNPASEPGLPWLALADELIRRHVAAELDWKTDRDDILWTVKQMTGYRLLSGKTRMSLDDVHCEQTETIGCLREIALRAAEDHVILAAMDIESDSYVILLLRQPDYLKAMHHADQLGFRFQDIREYDPNE